MNKQHYSVTEAGRLDSVVCALSGRTRSSIRAMLERGDVLLNGTTPNKPGIAVKPGDTVEISFNDLIEVSIAPQEVEFEIIYEDESFAVINKPQGLVVHPCESTPDMTLVNGLMNRLNDLSGINGELRPGIVHRLDKNTSGLLVVAKSDSAHISLQEQIQSKSAVRKYVALTDGVIKKDEGIIIANISRSHKDRKLMTVTREGGRNAETHYKVIKRYDKYTLIAFELKTGRTHQIRVHARHIGHPIVGDEAYGGSTRLYGGGQLLHAYSLAFNHPRTGERLEFRADLPEYFTKVISALDSDYINTVESIFDV